MVAGTMKRRLIVVVGWLLLIVSVYLLATRLHVQELLLSGKRLLHHPAWLLVMGVGYAAAFWLRSQAWAVQINGRVTVTQLWYYHHLGLLLNHLLPIKGGELARAALLRTRDEMTWRESLIAVGVNRLFDMAALLLLAAAALMLVAPAKVRVWYGGSVVIGIAAAAGIGGIWLVCRLAKKRLNWLAVFSLTAAGWLLEAIVLWSVVFALEGDLGMSQALLVHVLTIIGQTFHVTPGGIGTYEAVMTALLHQVADHPLPFALQVAILTHSFKFLYSFVLGGFAAWRLSLSPLVFYRRAVAESKEGHDEKSFPI
jgi:uncharacterized membrane protein YbhN (UPF0104 family)